MQKSLREIRDEVRRLIRDTSTTTPKWSDTEVSDAIRQSVREAGKAFFIREVYTSLAMTANQFDYAIPRYIQRIRNVKRDSTAATIVTDTTGLNWETVYDWDHIPTQDTNFLRINNPWSNYNLRIEYERDMPVPPIDQTTNAAVNPTRDNIPVSSSQQLHREWPLPGYFKIDSEVMRYEAVSATTFTSLTRGALGTMASSHASGSVVSAMFGDEDDKVEDYVFARTAANLWLQGMEAGGRRDAQAAYTNYQTWAARAEAARRRQRQEHLTRTIKAPTELS